MEDGKKMHFVTMFMSDTYEKDARVPRSYHSTAQTQRKEKQVNMKCNHVIQSNTRKREREKKQPWLEISNIN